MNKKTNEKQQVHKWIFKTCTMGAQSQFGCGIHTWMNVALGGGGEGS